jgi:hypothetical protein
MEETACVKEDFLNLKNHLNLAAKIELQTNEKMYENRLHHLEKMLEEMRHREESFMHIAEETNILKDQVDSLRELSLTSMRCDRPALTGRAPTATEDDSDDPGGPRRATHYAVLGPDDGHHPSLGEELAAGNISHDDLAVATNPCPVSEQPRAATLTFASTPASSKRSSPSRSSPVRVTGSVRLNLTPPLTKLSQDLNEKKALTTTSTAVNTPQPEEQFNCCSNAFAMAWRYFFDG